MTAPDLQPRAIAEAIQQAQEYVDRKARRNFCIGADQAKVNGYRLQATLIEEQVLPGFKKQLDVLRREQSTFLSAMTLEPPSKYKDRLRWEDQARAWNWKQQAKSVGRLDQYEYIYSFSSSLLHATPASLHQATLAEHEIGIFLDYILVSIADLADIAAEFLGTTMLTPLNKSTVLEQRLCQSPFTRH